MKKLILTTAFIIATISQANAWDKVTQDRIDRASMPTGETSRTAIRGLFNVFGYNTPKQDAELSERVIQRAIATKALNDDGYGDAFICDTNIDCETVTGR